MSATMLPLDQIGYDPEFYPRVNGSEDWLTVHRYKEVIQSHPWKAIAGKPGAFPPVVVVKATGYDWPHLLLDGLHRVRAFAAAGREEIGAIIERLPKSKWLERSVELNIDSKRPLDSGDKRWVATKLKADGWADDRIASLLCMKDESFAKLMATNVQKLTQASVKRITPGRSNRQIGKEHFGFLKAPFTPVSGTANAQRALNTQGSIASREARQIVESFASLIESGGIDPTDEYLAERLRHIYEVLGERVASAA